MANCFTPPQEGSSMIVSDWVNYYKEANGTEPSAEALQVVLRLDKLGQHFWNQGGQHALEHIEPLTEEFFADLTKKHYGDDPEWAELLAGLIYVYYMEGYEHGLENGSNRQTEAV